MSNNINGYIQNIEETLKKSYLGKFDVAYLDPETIDLLNTIQMFPDKQEEESVAPKVDVKGPLRIEVCNEKEEILTRIYKIVDNNVNDTTPKKIDKTISFGMKELLSQSLDQRDVRQKSERVFGNLENSSHLSRDQIPVPLANRKTGKSCLRAKETLRGLITKCSNMNIHSGEWIEQEGVYESSISNVSLEQNDKQTSLKIRRNELCFKDNAWNALRDMSNHEHTKNDHKREVHALNYGLNQDAKTSRKTNRAPLTTEDTKNDDKLDKLEGIEIMKRLEALNGMENVFNGQKSRHKVSRKKNICFGFCAGL